LEIIIHRINTIDELNKIESKFGTEIDIRAWGSNLIINHEPFQDGEKLIDYLDEYSHGTLVLNIKEAGIEDEVLRLVRERSHLKSYFLLDVEFPYLYSASNNGEKNIAVRFSEVESIRIAERFVGAVDWVWIDTNTIFPVDESNKDTLDQFKKCLVCPERWGRSKDIFDYRRRMDLINFKLDAVMTSLEYFPLWNN